MEVSTRVLSGHNPRSQSSRSLGKGASLSSGSRSLSMRRAEPNNMSKQIVSLDDFLSNNVSRSAEPSSVLDIKGATDEMIKQGISHRVNILGDDIDDSQISDISSDFASFLEDEVVTSFAMVNLRASENTGAADVQLTNLGLVSRVFHQITKSEIKFEHPFRRLHKVNFIWTPLFGGVDGTTTTIYIEDRRHSVPLIISEVSFNNSRNVAGSLSMDYCVAREDEKNIRVAYHTFEKPISSGAYGAMYVSIESVKTQNSAKLESRTPEVVYLSNAEIPKSVTPRQALDIGKAAALKRIEEAKKKIEAKNKLKKSESTIDGLHVTQLAKSIDNGTRSSSTFEKEEMYLTSDQENPVDINSWILDSGATNHFMFSDHTTEQILEYYPGVVETHIGYMIEDFVISTDPLIILPGVILSRDIRRNLISEYALINGGIIDRITTNEEGKLCYKGDKVLFKAVVKDKFYTCVF